MRRGPAERGVAHPPIREIACDRITGGERSAGAPPKRTGPGIQIQTGYLAILPKPLGWIFSFS